MTSPESLPPLDDARVAAIERTVFSRIGDERRRRRSRRTRWLTAGGAAAGLVVVAIVITPLAMRSVDSAVPLSGETVTRYEGSYEPLPPGAGGTAGDAAVRGDAASEDAAVSGSSESAVAPVEDRGSAAAGSRSIVSAGSATVTVDDVPAAADAIAIDARERGGYVESSSVGDSSAGRDVSADKPADAMAPYNPSGDGWVTVRVPADQLDAAIAALGEAGEVTASTVSRTDVTDQAIDLRARIAAAETSVQRLTELLAQSESTADLIAAESALQERQASLDADRQQLAALESQVDLATLSVQLAERTATVEADPAGFGDGAAAGWNGLVATLNGLVIALGFLLPWIAVLTVIGAVVWGIVTLTRRRRQRPTPTPTPTKE